VLCDMSVTCIARAVTGVLGHECDMWKVSCDMSVTFITDHN